MIDVERETSETFRRINAFLHERMRCPFEMDHRDAYHDLTFLGARFGRYVTEYVYCRPCAIIWQVVRGVFERATINKAGLVVPTPDSIDERNWRRTLARRKLRKERRGRCRQ